ncbi:MAG: hypothetical protein DRQ78_06650 [Epsilonproteobacteria bacterium]|nr:MAG: hypothetical protein DRQ78_06650 [Campylobacterota bacterium]
MKKTLLLSVVTSTMIMAGGDIAPVEPVVEAPAPVAGNTLADAFVNGTLTGEIKSVWSTSNFLGKADSTNVLALGGSLGYVTGSYHGLKLGVTFQTTHVLDASDDTGALKDFGPIDDQPLDISGERLSEAYLAYSLGNTTLKVGRQYIHTPLVSSANNGKSSEGLVSDSFAAALITNTDLPDTFLAAGYITEYQAKSDGLGNIGEFNDLEDGAFTFYVKNNSITDLTLQAQYAELKGNLPASDVNVIFLQSDYKLSGHTLSAQYFKSDSNDVDGSIWAVQATGPLGLGKLGYLVAYSDSMDDNSAAMGVGSGAGDALFTAVPVEGAGVPTRPNTSTVVGALVVPTSVATFIPYVGNSMKDDGLGDVLVYGAMAIAPIGKNFTLTAKYEYSNLENIFGPFAEEDNNIARVYASYTF